MGMIKKGMVEDRRTRREKAREEQTREEPVRYFGTSQKPKRNKGATYLKKGGKHE